MTFEKQKIDVREEITDKILSYLEKGVKPWECPYFKNFPANHKTNKEYSGINLLYLTIVAMEKKYQSNKWLSYQQAKEIGGNVKRGEKGTHIIFYSLPEKEEEENEKKVPIFKHYSVFNLDQCENIKDDNFNADSAKPITRDEKIDSFIKQLGVNISITSNNNYPCYVPAQDKIFMPENFKSSIGYYATMLHELAHWTGHEKRLNRFKKLMKFEKEAYAMEELIAEMGSAFLCALFNLEVEIENHASYIDSWIRVLKKDKKAIFLAAAKAQEIVNFLTHSVALVRAA